jgi:hypothetical protein
MLSAGETYRDLGRDSFTSRETPRTPRHAHRGGRSSLNELFLLGTMEGTRERRCCLSRRVGVETVGTDAGAAHSFDAPLPVHSFLLGAGRNGLARWPTWRSCRAQMPWSLSRR